MLSDISDFVNFVRKSNNERRTKCHVNEITLIYTKIFDFMCQICHYKIKKGKGEEEKLEKREKM